MNSSEQIRIAVAKLDVVTASRLATTLERVIELLPDARNEILICGATIDETLAAIGAHQRAEKHRWRDVN